MSTTTYAYAFHTTCDTPGSQGVFADIWALSDASSEAPRLVGE